MNLEKCALCAEYEDPRFGTTYKGRRYPLCDGCGGPENEAQQRALAAKLDALPPLTRSAGERERLRHSLSRLRQNVDNVELALEVGGPVGQDAQVIVQTAVEVASQLWRLDAFDLAERDALPSGPAHLKKDE